MSQRNKGKTPAGKHSPGTPAEWQRHLVGFFQSGNYAALAAESERALAIWPEFPFAWKALAIAQQALGQDARPAAERAAALAPNDPDALINLGNILREAGELDAALAQLNRAMQLNPQQPVYRINLAHAQLAAGQLAAAESNLRHAIALAPNLPEAHNNLGHTLFGQPGRLGEAIGAYRQALELRPDFRAAGDNFLFALNYLPGLDPAFMRQSAEWVAARFSQGVVPQPYSRAVGTADKPLRVGLVSGDFRAHSVGNLLAPVFASLRRQAAECGDCAGEIEIHLFANQTVDDAVSQRLRGAVAGWHPIWGLADAEVAAQIRSLSIDILVDLSGYTAHNRLPLFAHRAAPVQHAWLGYFATTGLPAIDYLLGAPAVLPEAEAGHLTERGWQLPATYYVYEPPMLDLAPAPPVARDQPPVFGCFSNLVKISDPVFAAWCEILQKAASAQIFCKAPQLNSPEYRSAMLQRFAAHGIEAHRVRLEGPSPYADYLRAYHEVDLILDTQPFPGGLTTCEALWMGVPVLTQRGDRLIGHQGEMVLGALGLSDWIASDPADYIARAVAYCQRRNDPEILAQRAGLRQRLLASPLCDVDEFARHLAQAWRGMWGSYVG